MMAKPKNTENDISTLYCEFHIKNWLKHTVTHSIIARSLISAAKIIC